MALGQRIRPQEALSDDYEELGSDDGTAEESGPPGNDTGEESEMAASDIEDEDKTDADGVDTDDDGDDTRADNAREQLRTIQFGTLAKAQASITQKRKRDSDTSPAHEEKLSALRERLRELRAQHVDRATKSSKISKGREHSSTAKASKSKTAAKGDRGAQRNESSSESDSDSTPETVRESHKSSRSSKHAPQVMSSSRQVSRKRIVIEPLAPKIKSRDPRFVNPTGAYDSNTVAKTYKFLDDYKVSELGDLKTQLANSKKSKLSAEDVEGLKLRIQAEENRARARKAADRRQEVIREHRRKEKEAILQGKKPFYLKKGEIKEQAQIKRYEGMNAKDRKRAMEKKQKKEGQRFKRAMPAARRFA